jgi:hypothetical protein
VVEALEVEDEPCDDHDDSVDLEPLDDPLLELRARSLEALPKGCDGRRVSVEDVHHDHGPFGAQRVMGDRAAGAERRLEQAITGLELVPRHGRPGPGSRR